MTTGTPAVIARRNGSSHGLSPSVVVSRTFAVWSVLARTCPSPGKCLTAAATPGPGKPVGERQHAGADRAGLGAERAAAHPDGEVGRAELGGQHVRNGREVEGDPGRLQLAAPGPRRRR